MLLGDLSVAFSADLSGLQSGIGGAAGLINGIGSLFGPAGDAAAQFANESLDAAGNFQQAMLKVQAYAGLSQQATDAMSQSIMQMSANVGVGPKELADALYPIISSGYSASQALDILSLSAKTAAASGASTAVVADALTTSLGAMHAPASQATAYMDMMNKMTSLGKGEIGDYAAVIGKLSLAAGSANVPFATMGAALADLTTHGFPSVAQASTSLGNLFTQIGPKVDALAKHAQALGLNFDETKFKTMDLGEKIAYLNQVTDGNQGEILKLLGGSTLAQKAFNALSGSSQAYTYNLSQMNNAQGTTASVFATASQGYEFQSKRQQAAFQALQVTIGSQLLPTMTSLQMWETNLIVAFTNWINSTQLITKAIDGLSSIIQSYAVPVFTTLGGIASTLFNAALPKIQQYASAMQNQLGTALDVTKGKFSQFDAYLNATALPAMHTYATSVVADYQKINDYALKTYMPTMQKVATTISQQTSMSSMSKDVGAAAVAFDGLVKTVQGFIQQGEKLVSDFLKPFEDYWNNKIMPAVHDAQPGFEKLGHALYDLAMAFAPLFPGGKVDMQQLNGFFLDLIPNMIRASGVIAGNLADAINIFTPKLGDAVQNIKDFADAVSQRMPQSVKDGFGAIIQDTFGFIGNWKTELSDVWTAITDIFSLGVDTVETWVLILLDLLNGNWAQMYTDVHVGWEKILTDVRNMFIDFVNWIGSSIGPQMSAALVDAIRQAVVGVAHIWNAVAGMIDDTMGGHVPLIPLPPGYASGTSYHPGGLAIVGENGPEIVNLPQGSQVYPTGTGPSGSSDGAQYIYLMLDSMVLAQAIGSKQQKLIYLSTGAK